MPSPPTAKVLGKDHPSTLASMNALGELYAANRVRRDEGGANCKLESFNRNAKFGTPIAKIPIECF